LLSFLNAAGTVKHRIAVAVGELRMLGRRRADSDDPRIQERRMEGAENDGDDAAMLRESVALAMLAKRVARAIVAFRWS